MTIMTIATTETREVTIAVMFRAVVACKSETQKSQKKKLGEFFTETLNYFFFGTHLWRRHSSITQ